MLMDELLAANVYSLVAGFPRYRVGTDGSICSLRKGTWLPLRGAYDKDGYHKIILCKDGKRYYRRTAAVILETFVGDKPSSKHEVRHLNGVRKDNRLSNLEWSTHKENIADKKKHGTWQGGNNASNRKLSEEDIPIIRHRRMCGERLIDIADDYNVTVCTISAVATGQNWKHIN